MTKQLAITLVCKILIGSVLLSGALAGAQSNSGFEDIENLFSQESDSSAAQPSAPPAEKSESSTPQANDDAQAAASPAAPQIKDVSDLDQLQSFSDVAVIQRRFLPKSERFETYLAPALNLNDAFFLGVGATARVGYYFLERYGIELTGFYLSTMNRQVTDDLFRRGVKTSSFVTPQGFYGIDFKWIPIYGKMTWANRQITPFDLYFSFGLALTPTNQKSNEMSLHLGTGQVFALSKAEAVRWDLSWYTFTSASSVDTSGSRSLYHNVLFSMGWSWFFPEAKYR